MKGNDMDHNGILHILTRIEEGLSDKELLRDPDQLFKRMDQLIALQQEQTDLLRLMTRDRCTCKKHKVKKEKEKKEKRTKKE